MANGAAPPCKSDIPLRRRNWGGGRRGRGTRRRCWRARATCKDSGHSTDEAKHVPPLSNGATERNMYVCTYSPRGRRVTRRCIVLPLPPPCCLCRSPALLPAVSGFLSFSFFHVCLLYSTVLYSTYLEYCPFRYGGAAGERSRGGRPTRAPDRCGGGGALAVSKHLAVPTCREGEPGARVQRRRV